MLSCNNKRECAFIILLLNVNKGLLVMKLKQKRGGKVPCFHVITKENVLLLFFC